MNNLFFCKRCEFYVDYELSYKFKFYEHNTKKCCHPEFVYLITDNIYNENYYKDKCPLKK